MIDTPAGEVQRAVVSSGVTEAYISACDRSAGSDLKRSVFDHRVTGVGIRAVERDCATAVLG